MEPERPDRQLTVDSISDGIARVEVAGRTLEVPSDWLPDGAGEGDVLSLRIERQGGRSTLRLERDPQATEQARRRIRSKLDRLRGREGR